MIEDANAPKNNGEADGWLSAALCFCMQGVVGVIPIVVLAVFSVIRI